MGPKRISTALRFHRIAGDFLASLGFVLSNHPEEADPFNGSVAWYRSERGLGISTTFNPVDAREARIWFGRVWILEGWGTYYSNSLSALAKRFGIALPETYDMSETDVEKLVRNVFTDVEQSLPTILSAVSLNDLIEVESDERNGAMPRARLLLGSNYSTHLQISSFIEIDRRR